MFLLLRKQSPSPQAGPSAADEGINTLKAQLEFMAQQSAISQTQMAEQMRNQEALLSKRLEESLGNMSERLSQNLTKQTQSTHDNLKSLAERLAVLLFLSRTRTQNIFLGSTLPATKSLPFVLIKLYSIQIVTLSV